MKFNNEVNKFINNNITLAQEDISKKAESRKNIIECIINKIKDKEDCLQVYKENTLEYIHFGSYFKGTKVSQVDEFDVLLIIDSNGGVFSVGGVKKGEGQGVVVPNPKYNGNYYKENSTDVSPRKIMNWLETVITEALDKTKYKVEVAKDGQAVTVKNEKEDYAIDFVPGGIFKDVDTDDVFYAIPKGDAKLGWIVTNPNLDKEIIKEKSLYNEQFKNTIRLFKYVLKSSYNIKISSYAIESSIVNYEENNTFENDYKADFIGVLEHIIALIDEENIPDMRDENINLYDIANKEATLTKLEKVRSGYYSLDGDKNNFYEDVEVFLKNE